MDNVARQTASGTPSQPYSEGGIRRGILYPTTQHQLCWNSIVIIIPVPAAALFNKHQIVFYYLFFPCFPLPPPLTSPLLGTPSPLNLLLLCLCPESGRSSMVINKVQNITLLQDQALPSTHMHISPLHPGWARQHSIRKGSQEHAKASKTVPNPHPEVLQITKPHSSNAYAKCPGWSPAGSLVFGSDFVSSHTPS